MNKWKITLLILSCQYFSTILSQSASNRSFTIDYENNQFLMDGEPFRYVAGEVHYFRVHQNYWSDRFAKMKAAGLNAVQTYIEWSQHEPQPGIYNFEDNLDFISFIVQAQNLGLYVIIRAGPYIDAAVDMGGFPPWLLTKHLDMYLRTNDTSYLQYVDSWFEVLLSKIKPYLYENGGPIISIQVENEYGSYPACDFSYMEHLRDLFRSVLGDTVVLFTTDGGSDYYLKCGKVEGLYATVDFGPGANVSASFEAQRQYEPSGPLVNSEFYPGWDDFYGQPFPNVSIDSIVETLNEILAMNASVSMYMFTGGTTFGFTNGAIDNPYTIYTTSYDYHAPISEAGDTTDKFMAIRNVISNYLPVPTDPIPANTSKYAYGSISMDVIGSFFDLLPFLTNGSEFSQWPQSFEELGQSYGFVLYETTIEDNFMQPAYLNIPKIADRGYIFVDKVYAGILSRVDNITQVPIRVLKNQTLSILVENQGRVAYGPTNNDSKGIFGNNSVTIGGYAITNWLMRKIPFTDSRSTNIQNIKNILNKLVRNRFNSVSASIVPNDCPIVYPALFMGDFFVSDDADHPMDTFLDMTGWSKGVIFINGINLGKYWPTVGPHRTSFISKFELKPYPEANQIIIFEQESSPCSTGVDFCSVSLINYPILESTTPLP